MHLMFCLFHDEAVKVRTNVRWLAVSFMYVLQVIVKLY
jgi:hypothetical protein